MLKRKEETYVLSRSRTRYRAAIILRPADHHWERQISVVIEMDLFRKSMQRGKSEFRNECIAIMPNGYSGYIYSRTIYYYIYKYKYTNKINYLVMIFGICCDSIVRLAPYLMKTIGAACPRFKRN